MPLYRSWVVSQATKMSAVCSLEYLDTQLNLTSFFNSWFGLKLSLRLKGRSGE